MNLTFFADLYKWIVNLDAYKALIAVLLALSIFFGIVIYHENSQYKKELGELQDKYDKLQEKKDFDKTKCDSITAIVNDKWQQKYDDYRKSVEEDNQKYRDKLESKLEEMENKYWGLNKRANRVEKSSKQIIKKELQ